MEISFPCDNDGPQFVTVTKRLREANGILTGVAHEWDTILGTQMFEVILLDGYRVLITAYITAEHLFVQINNNGNMFVLIDAIEDNRTASKEIKESESFIISNSGDKRCCETTIV